MNRIYLVRHGQSEGNVDNALYFDKADKDILLTPKGEQQAKEAGCKLVELLADYYEPLIRKWVNVIYSPYTRAICTKNIAMQELSRFGYQKSSELCYEKVRERSWGKLRDISFNGTATEEHFSFNYIPENGESYACCYKRAAEFDKELESLNLMAPVIIFSHGEWIRCYLTHKLGWTEEEHDFTHGPWNGEVFMLERKDENSEYVLSDKTPVRKKDTRKVYN